MRVSSSAARRGIHALLLLLDDGEKADKRADVTVDLTDEVPTVDPILPTNVAAVVPLPLTTIDDYNQGERYVVHSR